MLDKVMYVSCERRDNLDPTCFNELNEVAALAVASLQFKHIRDSLIVFTDDGGIDMPNWDGEDNCVAMWNMYGDSILRDVYGLISADVRSFVFNNIKDRVIIPLDIMTNDRRLPVESGYDYYSPRYACINGILEYRRMLDRTIRSYIK